MEPSVLLAAWMIKIKSTEQKRTYQDGTWKKRKKEKEKKNEDRKKSITVFEANHGH